MRPAIIWFRRNLRLRDNESLHAAAASGQPLIPVYVDDSGDLGGASRWWLHHSLVALGSSLSRLGAPLLIVRGPAASAIAGIAASTGADRVFFTRRREPAARREEADVESALAGLAEVESFDDAFLHPPAAVLTQSGKPYRVFTPFWRAAERLGEPPAPRAAPTRLTGARHGVASLQPDELGLLPESPDWTGGLRDTWQPGEPGAQARLDALGDTVSDYAVDRDRPDLDATTRLSPHLHFGELSVRDAWHAIRAAEAGGASSRGAEALLRQLYWREFSAYLLYHCPGLPLRPLREEFDLFPWIDDAGLFRAWQRGLTGYPIVDAGMRQLWHTGWMHNRVRMIAASFLVKDLMIPWQRGAEWFLDTLVDADLANNSASWQWVAGCGTDAAPYFRVFNPVLQGRKFDPDGAYVRRWVPELSGLPAEAIHAPSLADPRVLDAAGVRPGTNYPMPIVDHGVARERALAAYDLVRAAA